MTLWIGHRYSSDRIDMEKDFFGHQLGTEIHRFVDPGKAVATNQDFNPMIPGNHDRYLLSAPVLSYYADRVIRGGIRTIDLLETVRRQRDDIAYFLFMADLIERDRELLFYLRSHYTNESPSPRWALFPLSDDS